jgi:inositol transport system substrate-binding protein
MLFAMSSMLAFADTTITIGVTMNNLATEYTANLAKAIEKKAKEVNVKIVMDDAQGKADIQTSQIENFIARKVDAVIMQPIEAEAMSPSVKKLQAAGIPIINVNSITTAEPDAYVGSRDEEAGVLAVNYIASCIKGKGNIVMMHGHPGQSAEIQRTDGAKSAIAKYPDIKLIAEQTAEWNRNQAMNLMQNWLSANKDKINGVFAQNDEMAMGALKALEDSKVKKQIVLVGVDGIRDALKAVKDGRLNATVLQDATGQGAGAVEIAIKAAKKESFEKNTYIPFVLVTSENIGKFYTK